MGRTAVIITALPVEYAAVASYFRGLREREDDYGTVYEVGTLGDWEVWLAEVGAGNTNAAARVERLLNFIKPKPTAAIFVGVAGGIKDVVIGDVVVATKVYGFESGKDTDGGFLPRPSVGQSTYRLLERARVVARRWKRGKAHALLGPIAAGEKVVAGKRSETATFLRGTYGDTLAVEMEGRGFLAALEAHRLIEALVVRGISDLLGGKSKADRAGSQQLASANAAAFVIAVLRQLPSRSEAIAAGAAPELDAEGVLSGTPANDLIGPAPTVGRPARTDAARWRVRLEGTVSEVTTIELDEILRALRRVASDCRLTIDQVDDGSIIILYRTDSGARIAEAVLERGLMHFYGFPIMELTEQVEPLSPSARDDGLAWRLQNALENELRRPTPHFEETPHEVLSGRIMLLVKRGEISPELALVVKQWLVDGDKYEHPVTQTWNGIAIAAAVRRSRLARWLADDMSHNLIWRIRPSDTGNLFAAIAVEAPSFDYEYEVLARAVALFNARTGKELERAMPLVPVVDYGEILEFRLRETMRALAEPEAADTGYWRWPASWGDIHFNSPVLSWSRFDGPGLMADIERLTRAIRRYRDPLFVLDRSVFVDLWTTTLPPSDL